MKAIQRGEQLRSGSSAQLRAVKAQKASTQELLTLIDTANAPIFGVDTELRITEWNQKAASITGYQKDEVLGRALVETYITPEYHDPCAAA